MSSDRGYKSPLLLERSQQEFQRQVETVYETKMIPRPTSVHGSTLGRPNGDAKSSTLNRGLPNGAAYVQNRSKNPFVRCCHGFQSCVDDSIDRFFYNYGKCVAKYPIVVIFICLLIATVCGLGLFKFTQENTGIKLWIPRDSSQRYVNCGVNCEPT